MATRSYAQIAPRSGYMVTHTDTMWLYPLKFLNITLDAKIVPYRYDGINIVCKDLADLATLYQDLFAYTAIIPIGGSDGGFSLGPGTLLQDYGREMYWRTEDNTFWIHWRMVNQLTNQTDLPVRGSSPIGTVGFITVDTSYGDEIPDPYKPVFERCLTMRLG